MVSAKEKIRLSIARLVAHAPYLSSFTQELTLVPTDQVKIAGIVFPIVYYNERVILEMFDNEVCGVILHEIMHYLLVHWLRKPEGADHETWNYAADMEINDFIERLQIQIIHLPEGAVYPRTFGLPANQTAEWYFEHLLKKLRKDGRKPGKEEDEDESEGEPGEDEGEEEEEGGEPGIPGKPKAPPKKRKRPKEAGFPTECGGLEHPANVPKEYLRGVIEKTLEDMQKHLKEIGTSAACLEAAIQALRPRIEWQEVLRDVVGWIKSYLRTAFQQWTYSHPSRRRIPGILLPARRSFLPKVAIILDVSGSMLNEYSQEFSEAVEALSALQGAAEIITWDVQEIQKFRSLSELFEQLSTGKTIVGGGTDMAEAVRQMAQKDYSVIVVLTDGESPLPTKDDAKGKPLVWIVFGKSEGEFTPPYGRVIYIDKG
jgi:predicted metal-dependent peptidase